MLLFLAIMKFILSSKKACVYKQCLIVKKLCRNTFTIGRYKVSKIHPKWLVVIAVLFGTFTVILNNSMLNPTLPQFMKLFDVDAVAISWILTIFMVSTGMIMPLTGFLDRKSTRLNS